MKKLTIILSLVLLLGGCAWMTKQIDYAKLCQKDATCLAQAKSDAELAKGIVGIAYPFAAGAAGALILSLSLWIRGKKVSK